MKIVYLQKQQSMEQEPNRNVLSLFNKDESVKKHLKQNQAHYFRIAQLAYYADLTKIQTLQIFTKSSYDVECNIIFSYHACKYREELKDNIQCFIVRTLEEQLPKIKNQFSLAYVHHSLGDFKAFKNIVSSLPEHFLSNQRRYDYKIVSDGLSNEHEQVVKSIYNIYRIVSGCQCRIQQIQRINKVTINKPVTKSKIKGQSNSLQNYHLEKTPQSRVEIIRNQLYGKPLHQYKMGVSKIPYIIQLLLHKLIANDEYARAEGIFRKNCDADQLELLQNELINQNYDFLKAIQDPYVIVGCLKKIFHNLDTPLFSYQIYNQILKFRPEQKQEQIPFIQGIFKIMSQLQQRVLLFLCAFLLKVIIANKEFNKMNSYNIAVVLGPCLFRPLQYGLQDLMNSGKYAKIILNWLDHFQQIIQKQTAEHYYQMLEELKIAYP